MEGFVRGTGWHRGWAEHEEYDGAIEPLIAHIAAM